jgi:ankyrin repeat protein
MDEEQIYELIKERKISTLKELIKENKQIVNMKIQGKPLLMIAYLFEDYELIQLLLENGADATIPDENNETIISRAIEFNKALVLLMLKENGFIDLDQEEETKQFVREKFKWEGFTVVNAGLNEEHMKEVLSALQPIIKKMKKFGFGKLLYGPLIITGKDLEGATYDAVNKSWANLKWAAYYSNSKDLVVINSKHFLNDIHDNMRIFAHELAHRHWYRFMDPSERQLRTGKFNERGFTIDQAHVDYIEHLFNSSAPENIDALGFKYREWDKFDYDKFMRGLNAKQEKYKLKEIFDTIVAQSHGGKLPGNLKTERRKFVEDKLIEVGAIGGIENVCKKIGLVADYLAYKTPLEDLPRNVAFEIERSISYYGNRGAYLHEWMQEQLKSFQKRIKAYLEKVVGKTIIRPTSTTEYGSTRSEEDYAEAFGYFFANKGIPREIFNLFVRVNKLRISKKIIK